MEELCLKLKQDLENYFSMPFEIQPVFKDGEVHYVCSPYNEDQMYFSVEVYIHNKIRLVIEIYPQKHGGYILNEMAHAPEEKQSTFFSYKQMLVDKGLKSCYSVNKSDLLKKNRFYFVETYKLSHIADMVLLFSLKLLLVPCQIEYL